MKRNATMILLLFACMMGVILCGNQLIEAKNSTKKSKKTVTKELEISVGEKHKLKLKNIKKYTFSSKDKEIATVNKKGVIKGKRKGKCTIKACSDKKKYVYSLSVKGTGGYMAVLAGVVTNVEVRSENTVRYTVEMSKGMTALLSGDDLNQKKYYVADCDISKGAKVGDYITLYTNYNDETCKGTLVNEDTVYLTGVH